MSMKYIKNKFCSFVYSNCVKYRNNFCKSLAKYKKVSCGGKCLNNIGTKVSDKLLFQKQFKFGISFENSSTHGYVTEKILDTFSSNSIPIYYGSPNIEEYFNPQTFINGHKFKNYDELIEYIKKIDNNEDLYKSYFNKPILSEKWQKILSDPEETYFRNIAKKFMIKIYFIL